MPVHTDDWPAARGWRPDPEAALRLPASRHATRLMLDDAGGRVLLKPVGPHEPTVLRALAALGPGPLALPEVLAAPPEAPVLALRWIEGARNLAQHELATGEWLPARAAAIGRALGWLHARTAAPAPGLEAARAPDELRALVYLEPDLYARLSPAGRSFYERLQALPDAFDALYDLLAPAPATTWLHGDCKLANWVLAPGAADRLVLLDWEAAGRGDPARDLGEIGASYVAARWLAVSAPPLPAETLKACLAALLAAYRAERTVEAGFVERVVRWTGVALLWTVLSMAQDARLAAVTAETLAPARMLLVRPEVGAVEVWGA